MSFEVTTLNIDLIRDTATVTLGDEKPFRQVRVTVAIQTPGNKPENQLKGIATEAAKRALQDALDAL